MEAKEQETKVEIQKTLISINDITLKIRREMEVINNLIEDNGQMQVAVSNANQALRKTAEKMGLNVEDLLKNVKTPVTETGLVSAITSDVMTEKILSCITE